LIDRQQVLRTEDLYYHRAGKYPCRQLETGLVQRSHRSASFHDNRKSEGLPTRREAQLEPVVHAGTELEVVRGPARSSAEVERAADDLDLSAFPEDSRVAEVIAQGPVLSGIIFEDPAEIEHSLGQAAEANDRRGNRLSQRERSKVDYLLPKLV